MVTAEDSPRVLVTGANGYIAGHIIKELCKLEYTVRGSLRPSEANNTDLGKAIQSLNTKPDSSSPIEIVYAELTKSEDWPRAVSGCDYVIHVAGPSYSVDTIASEPDVVIKPAVDGAINLLTACKASKTVKRVVFTSSFAAIIGDPSLVENREYTEKDWTNIENENLEIYPKAETMAEKAAWDFIKELNEDEKFELVVLNPVCVLGPLLLPGATGAGTEIIKKLMDKEVQAVSKLNVQIVDVRDVALAHVRAMTIKEAEGQRFILCNRSMWMKEMAHVLSKEFKHHGYSIPTVQMPYIALWVKSFFDKTLKKYLPSVGKEIRCNNENMKNVLGVIPREMHSTIIDMTKSMIEFNIITKEPNQGSSSPTKASKKKRVKDTTENKENANVSEDGGLENETPPVVQTTEEKIEESSALGSTTASKENSSARGTSGSKIFAWPSFLRRKSGPLNNKHENGNSSASVNATTPKNNENGGEKTCKDEESKSNSPPEVNFFSTDVIAVSCAEEDAPTNEEKGLQGELKENDKNTELEDESCEQEKQECASQEEEAKMDETEIAEKTQNAVSGAGTLVNAPA